MTPATPRIAVFTHDTFGLGHVRRCARILRALSERAPGSALLFVTGSPAVHAAGALPPNADVVKIPTIVRTGSDASRPPHLPIPLDEVSRLRRNLIQEAVLGFGPDVFLVDNFPLGARRELLPTLRELGRRPVQVVLGLRDILDAPEIVRADWTRQGVYSVLERCYDRILVYGMRDVLDLAEAYGLPPETASKLHYCGYVTETGRTRAADDVRAELGVGSPFLLATGGGGGDAFPLLSAVLEALPLVGGDLSAALVAGPLMGARDRERLRAAAAGRSRVTLPDSVPDLRSALAAADVVVSMGGYNLAAEIVAVGARAVIVPRTWRYGEHERRETVAVEWEQRLRAEALARQGLADVLPADELTPQRLAERIRAALARPRAAPTGGVDLGGLERVVDHVLELARTPKEVAHVEA